MFNRNFNNKMHFLFYSIFLISTNKTNLNINTINKYLINCLVLVSCLELFNNVEAFGNTFNEFIILKTNEPIFI